MIVRRVTSSRSARSERRRARWPTFSSVLDAGRPEGRVREQDHLGVGAGRVHADQLGPELPELPVPPLLRPLVPEAVVDVVPAERLGQHPGLVHVHPQHGRGQLGPERDRPPALVLERVHLVDDPGPRAEGEELELLEGRRPDRPVAEAARRLAHAPLDLGARLHLVREEVPGSARSLQHPYKIRPVGLSLFPRRVARWRGRAWTRSSRSARARPGPGGRARAG